MASAGRPGPGPGPGLGPRGAVPAWKREILERRRAKLAGLGSGSGSGAEPEALVVAESLGPLRENPFLRLEAARRRGAGSGSGARPGPKPKPGPPAKVQPQLLELCSLVPGVRTIRADNILIIETAGPGLDLDLDSDPDPAAEPAPAPGPAARIRAAEVLVYEAPPPSPGRVSRLLQKFDAPGRRRGHSPSRAPGPGPDARRGGFLHKTGSNSFTVHPRGLPNGPAAPERPVAANGLEGSTPEPGPWKPKAGPAASPPPRTASLRTPSATRAFAAAPPPASATATPSQRRWVSGAASANDSFEIRPAPKPDLRAIPAGDLQARALASLRAHSRNSFVLVPKRRAPGAAAPHLRPAVATSGSRSADCKDPPGQQLGANGLSPPSSRQEVQGCPRPATALADPRSLQQPSPPASPSPGATAEAGPTQGSWAPEFPENGTEPGLPVTFIDEMDSEDEAPGDAKLPCARAAQRHPHPPAPGHLSGSELPHRGGSTFLVVPKRKPGVLVASGEPGAPEGEGPGRLSEPPASPGPTLKLRYPTVNEIEVVGGYLALQRSCLAKAGSSRKKVSGQGNECNGAREHF